MLMFTIHSTLQEDKVSVEDYSQAKRNNSKKKKDKARPQSELILSSEELAYEQQQYQQFQQRQQQQQQQLQQSQRLQQQKGTNGKYLDVSSLPQVRALYDYHARSSGELAFRKGDIITILNTIDDQWWEGSLNGKVGFVAAAYVSPDPVRIDPDPLQVREFGVENENVDNEWILMVIILGLLRNRGFSLVDRM